MLTEEIATGWYFRSYSSNVTFRLRVLSTYDDLRNFSFWYAVWFKTFLFVFYCCFTNSKVAVTSSYCPDSCWL